MGNKIRVRIDFRNDLYNHMIGEIKHYAEVMNDKDSGKDAKNLIRTIEKHVQLGTEDDGTEFAIIRLFPSDVSKLVGILAIVASTSIDIPDDHYSRLKIQRDKQSK